MRTQGNSPAPGAEIRTCEIKALFSTRSGAYTRPKDFARISRRRRGPATSRIDGTVETLAKSDRGSVRQLKVPG